MTRKKKRQKTEASDKETGLPKQVPITQQLWQLYGDRPGIKADVFGARAATSQEIENTILRRPTRSKEA